MERPRPSLLVLPFAGRRTVTAAVWTLHGAAHDPENMAGATHLVEHLTLRRCGGRERIELARLVDRLGGDVDAWTSSEAMCLSVETTCDALPDALELLSDAMLEPTFDREDVELERRVALAELDLVRDDPADQVEEAVLQAAWGRHPLARTVIGTARTLRRLTPTALARHHRELVATGRLLAVVAGDVDPAEVDRGLARLPLDRFATAPPLPPLRWKGGRVTVDRRPGEQVHARLAFPAPASGDASVPALTVLNRLLGVGASSRLFQRLREEEGLTYDVWSGLSLRRQGGLVEVGWACGPEVFADAWRVVREEIGRLPADLEAEEVAVAREALVRGIVMDAEDPAGLASLEAGELLERGRRFRLEQAVAELEAVSTDDVAALASDLLRLDRSASALCGPKGLAAQVA